MNYQASEFLRTVAFLSSVRSEYPESMCSRTHSEGALLAVAVAAFILQCFRSWLVLVVLRLVQITIENLLLAVSAIE
jgi:hypothetical protein